MSQSAFIALSRLEWRRTGKEGAVAALQTVFDRTDDDELDDPWWSYGMLQGRRTNEWLETLRALVPPRPAS